MLNSAAKPRPLEVVAAFSNKAPEDGCMGKNTLLLHAAIARPSGPGRTNSCQGCVLTVVVLLQKLQQFMLA